MLKQRELNERIHRFMQQKMEEFPELRQIR